MDTQNLIGQTLDAKYRIIKEIGRGGMGAVYYAVHTGTKRPVAVKVIVPQFMRHAEFVGRFRLEAEAAGRLHHPNVVDVTDFGFAETDAGSLAYLVMEYLDGCSLGDILEEENKLSLAWTVDILEQVCSAVAEAHRHGIIHRDLKPDNIWLQPNLSGGYTVKVLDFGIAKLESQTDDFIPETDDRNVPTTQIIPPTYALIGESDPTEIAPASFSSSVRTGFETLIEHGVGDAIERPGSSLTLLMDRVDSTPSKQPIHDEQKATKIIPKIVETDRSNLYERSTAELTRVGALMGTPHYMSPEQCRAERLGTSSDIYSLGVIAYQMLSGRLPFEGEHIPVITGHLQFPPPPLNVRKIPRKVERVIKSALSKEPIDRPETAELFSGQLRSHSEGIISIFRRAFVVYIENFTRLVWFSLLLYFPTILLAGVTLFIAILQFNGVFLSGLPGLFLSIVLGFVKHLNIAIGVAAETLIAAAVAWIVVQYIDAPLGSFRVSRALRALFEKWKQFLWILPLRMVLAILIQGDLTGFPVPLVFLLSSIDTFIFWFLPCVIMIENHTGFAAIKRGWRLSLTVFSTVWAGILANLIIFFITGVSITLVVISLAAFISQHLFLSVYEMPVDEFTRLINGVIVGSIKFAGVVLLPFFAVVSTLIYLKARHAGGESMRLLLNLIKESEVLQTNWQRRMRHTKSNNR